MDALEGSTTRANGEAAQPAPGSSTDNAAADASRCVHSRVCALIQAGGWVGARAHIELVEAGLIGVEWSWAGQGTGRQKGPWDVLTTRSSLGTC